ncbi:discoidin domain-containing protein [Streptomyces coffeae]|uniref:Discoidin domain-containing protein n=1 Tax=Streptomyces coffeae TaxID=621382 RepID=A0ABS1NRD0_9ACTN|nr:discoidin domain-containing protein [Streptomyces coffeae]MBL1102583.1 discoidin domain-containing protein [Streptomyces coffeae]
MRETDLNTGTDSELIVPIRLHTLVVNATVTADHTWTPAFRFMLERAADAEPPNPTYGSLGTGVHIQWELPEVLARGHYRSATGETTFPLVPNRWLVVRYATKAGRRQAVGWVVHSDYLQNSDYEGALGNGTSAYLTDRAPSGESVAAHTDMIGRSHPLQDADGNDRPWTDPDPQGRRPLFLSAVGPGLPAFAAFASYHKNVFCLHDTLLDLKLPGDSHVADNELSYLVVGWYSDPDADILTRAKDIPDLLPEDATIQEVLAALEWTAPSATSALRHTRYCGSSLGIAWSHNRPMHSTQPTSPADLKLAIGHSTAEATAELVRRQTRSHLDGELIKALFTGTIETYGLPEGAVELDEATRRAWYAGSEGGYLWQIVPRPSDDAEPASPVPAWLADLNCAQGEYDDLADRLARTRARLWDLWWLRHLPEAHHDRPDDFNDDADAQLNPENEGAIANTVQEYLDRMTQLTVGRDALPMGDTPEALQDAIDTYARAHGLTTDLELKRTARDPYYSPADPVVAIAGSGTRQPLGRDPKDPLPCRLPSALLTSITIDGLPPFLPDPAAPRPTLANLPAICATLLDEFALLDKAAFTRIDGSTATALEAALSGAGTIEGQAPAYLGVWQQPWHPMYLQWEIRYCPTPFRTGAGDNWTFDGSTYQWTGQGALAHDGAENQWPAFTGRSYLTPTSPYVLRQQVRRYLQTYSTAETEGLDTLLGIYADLDVVSQTLDGFNDWLLRQDGGARLIPPAALADAQLLGDPQRVPSPGRPDDPPNDERFQPVRAGQFYFHRLQIIDRFGRTAPFMSNNDPGTLWPYPAASVLPDRGKPLYVPQGEERPPNNHRFIQLPPRLMQPARVHLAPIRAADSAGYAGLPPADDPAATPVVGWLMLNYLDQTLLVYAPDGSPLGELRVVGDRARVAWTMLPHAPYARPEDFAGAYPELSTMVVALRTSGPASFDALLTTINDSLESITDPSAQADRSPARLIGRPLALIRAELAIQLQGPPLTNPSWQQILDPNDEDYPDYRWPVRLGKPDLLEDGLIGYYASDTGPGGDTHYGVLNTVEKNPPHDPYLNPIITGTDLALRATPNGESQVHRLTLLADPHTAIHATTDILPVADLALDTDLVQQALARIEASFRLDPLLAPTSAGHQSATASDALGESPGHGLAHLLDGDLGTWYLSGASATRGDWIVLDFEEVHDVHRIDLYPGDALGENQLPACEVEFLDEDGQEWTVLDSFPAGTEIHYIPPAPVPTRQLRLRFTADATAPVAIRTFSATTDAGDNGLVMPRPAAWFGDWSWAEPYDTADGTGWARLPILPADRSAHLDDAVPTARAGYLQLRPRRD